MLYPYYFFQIGNARHRSKNIKNSPKARSAQLAAAQRQRQLEAEAEENSKPVFNETCPVEERVLNF